MLLKDKITELIAESMKAHNHERTETLRLIKAELLKAETMNPKDPSYEPYSEQLENKVILKMVASHKDSITQFAGRQDLIDKEEAELKIIQEFAPKEASVEEITNYTKSIIDNLLSEDTKVSMKNMKEILQEVKVKYPTADGKLVSSVLKTYL